MNTNRQSNKAARKAGDVFPGWTAKFSGAQKLACVSGWLKPEFPEYIGNFFTQTEVDEIVSEARQAISNDAESKAAMIHELAPSVVATILDRDGFLH